MLTLLEKQCIIKNYEKILDMNEQTVVLLLNGMIYTIVGQSLNIQYYSKHEVRLKGQILSIHLKQVDHARI